MSKPKIIAIIGPTASGKSALAVEIAKAVHGEVISADSRQVYKGMDIGTGKVTSEEMQGVPHHLLDIVSPEQIYTGTDFISDSSSVITDILARGKTPIIAGGTFFYLDLLRGRMQVAPVPPNPTLRTSLERLSDAELLAQLQTFDPVAAGWIDTHNRRRLIRAIEICTAVGTVPKSIPQESPYDWLILGIDVPVETLNERIMTRLNERLNNGMVEEVKQLHQDGLSWERLDSFGLEYRFCGRYLRDELSRDDLVVQLAAKIRQYAKRQRTWLRRDNEITWLPFPVDVVATVAKATDFLAQT